MVIESNISEIPLNVLPVYTIAPDKRIFPFPAFLLFAVGWDCHMCICLLWHFIMTRRVLQVCADVCFVFFLSVKQNGAATTSLAKRLNLF